MGDIVINQTCINWQYTLMTHLPLLVFGLIACCFAISLIFIKSGDKN
jgi:hypothetical protein